MPILFVPVSFKTSDKPEAEVDWEKVKNFALALSSIISACAIPIVGHWVSKSLKQKEIGLRYTELAIQILSNEPVPDTANVRKWATDVVNHYSDIKLSTEARSELESFPLSDLEKGLGILREVNSLRALEELSKELRSLELSNEPDKTPKVPN